MQRYTTLLSAIAAVPAVHGIAFGGPAPTAISPERALNGWNPEPTKGPSVAELRKRQSNLFPETCGWVDGDYSSAITCGSDRTCMLYTASGLIDGMAGCCSGSDTQNCAWASSCVPYSAYTAGSCDSGCQSNEFNRICSDSDAPYCVTWTYPLDGIADYGCASTSPFGIETVLQEATDFSDSFTTTMTLPTVSEDAVTGWDGSSTVESSDVTATDAAINTASDNDISATESDDPTQATDLPSSGGSSSSSRKKTKTIGVGLIVGIVIVALFVLFLIGAAVIFFCVKKKKQRQLAANQQAIAAAQANRPQSQYQQPLQMQQQFPGPMPQRPQPQVNGYFAPQGPNEQKINPQTQVHEYGIPSPISNPSTPAPAYMQPYYAAPNAPPVPTQSPAPYPAREPTPGAHEFHAMSASHVPTSQGHADQPVYEMGNVR